MYKSYPIVKIKGTVAVLRKELKTTDTSFNFNVCWSLQSNVFKPISVNITIMLDQKFKRANFSDETNELEFNATAQSDEQCREIVAAVEFSYVHVFKPIDIEMHYNVWNAVPNSNGEFFFLLILLAAAV